MSHPRLPREITDYIIDLLQDEQKTLEQCRLVAKSWVPRARKHLFAVIRFDSPADPTAWVGTFPDSANSPGYLARCLHVACVKDFAAEVVRSHDWIRSFSNVVRLEIRGDYGTAPSLVFEIVCSLPCLKDLNIIGHSRDHNPLNPLQTFRPQISPPLTGTLSLDLPRNMQGVVRTLLDLPDGVHFRRFVGTRYFRVQLEYIMALVEACSRTLEFFDIKFRPFTILQSWKDSINLSVATKLKVVVFRPVPYRVEWVTMGLRTITPAHKDLREVSLIFPSISIPIDRGFDESTYIQWAGLDRVLVQLWLSHSVRAKLVYAARSELEASGRVREFINKLLPETMEGGAIDLVDGGADLL